MDHKVKDYVLLLISIFIIGFAITLITMTGLGATAVTSLAFVISQLSGVSFGTLTGLFNVLWVVLQIAIKRKAFPKIQLLQFVVAIILGVAVDVATVLLSGLVLHTYFQQIAVLILGSIIMGFGVSLQLKAATIYNPAEGIVAVLADTTRRPFGFVKTMFDGTLVLLAVLLGLFAAGEVIGVREGTIISALLIGPITGMFQQLFEKATVAQH